MCFDRSSTNLFSDSICFSGLSRLTVWLEVVLLHQEFLFHSKDQSNVFSDISKPILRYLWRSSLILLPNTKKCYHMMCYIFIYLPKCKSFPLINYSGKATAATPHASSYSWSCYGGPFTSLSPQSRAMTLHCIIVTEGSLIFYSPINLTLIPWYKPYYHQARDQNCSKLIVIQYSYSPLYSRDEDELLIRHHIVPAYSCDAASLVLVPIMCMLDDVNTS